MPVAFAGMVPSANRGGRQAATFGPPVSIGLARSAVPPVMEGERGAGGATRSDQPGGKAGVSALGAEPFGVDAFEDRHQPAAAPFVLRDDRVGTVGDLDKPAALGDPDPPPIDALQHRVDVAL